MRKVSQVKTTLTITVEVGESGYARVSADHDPAVTLTPGVYVAQVEADTRERTLGEIAGDLYRTTLDFDKIAAVVIDTYEARKVSK